MLPLPGRRRAGPPLPPLRAAALAAALAAPIAATAATDDWKAANDAVGAFPRGHADILRWERQQAPTTPPAAPPAAVEPWRVEDVVAAAMRGRPDLVAVPGISALESTRLRVEARAFAHDVERAWIRAIAAAQSAAYQAQVLEAAAAGAELAQRMLRVGNWNAARQMQQELTLLDAQARLAAARHAATAALADLARLLPAAPGQASALMPLPELAARLPTRLPPLPAAAATGGGDAPDLAALEQQALQAHPQWPLLAGEAARIEAGLAWASRQAIARAVDDAVAAAAAQGRWPAVVEPARNWPHGWTQAARERAAADALERTIRADVRVAYDAGQMARSLAGETLREVQRLQAALEEDMVQRYNGMLKSTWDLLASSRERVLAVDAALQAQRDAWLARAELAAVLAGLPYTGSAPGAATGVAGKAAGGH